MAMQGKYGKLGLPEEHRMGCPFVVSEEGQKSFPQRVGRIEFFPTDKVRQRYSGVGLPVESLLTQGLGKDDQGQ